MAVLRRRLTVRMLTGIAGPELALEPGDQHAFPAELARRLVESGQAEPVGQWPDEKRKESAGAGPR